MIFSIQFDDEKSLMFSNAIQKWKTPSEVASSPLNIEQEAMGLKDKTTRSRTLALPKDDDSTSIY